MWGGWVAPYKAVVLSTLLRGTGEGELGIKSDTGRARPVLFALDKAGAIIGWGEPGGKKVFKWD